MFLFQLKQSNFSSLRQSYHLKAIKQHVLTCLDKTGLHKHSSEIGIPLLIIEKPFYTTGSLFTVKTQR